MSTLSQYDIAKRARERLTDWPEAKVGFTVPRLETMVNGALRRLAEVIAADPGQRDLLRPTSASPYTATLSAGQVDLASTVTAELLLLSHLNEADFYMVDASVSPTRFQIVGSLDELQLRRIVDSMFIHAYVGNTVLYTRNVDSALDTLEGDVEFWANFIPTMTTLPQELEQPLVDVVVEMALAGLKAGGQ